jgi:hypothetical protein
VVNSVLTSADSGVITVVAGAPVLSINRVPASINTVDAAFSTQPWILVADAAGNPISGTTVTVSLASGSGVLQGTLTAVSDAYGLAKFTNLGYNKTDAFQLHFAAGALSVNAPVFGPLTAGVATQIKVETAANGSGTVVLARSLNPDNLLTVYSITRDQFGNFVANTAATWSLTSITSSVAGTDLVAAVDNLSANFTAHLAGTGIIHAVNGALISVDSGTITVAAAVVYSGGGGGGGGSPSAVNLQPSGFTSTLGMAINANTGKIQSDNHLVTADGKVKLDILKDTTLLQKSGAALSTLTVAPMANPPAPPAANALVLAYTFGPDGATFNPALTLTLSYDPANLPANVAEKDLYVSYYDGTNWISLVSTVDPLTKTITAQISHFSTYAVMGSIKTPAPVVTPAPTPTATVPATPVVTAPIATPIITTPASTPVATTAPTAAVTATPAPAPKPASNYAWLIILGVVVVVAVVIAVIATSRKKRPEKK